MSIIASNDPEMYNVPTLMQQQYEFHNALTFLRLIIV